MRGEIEDQISRYKLQDRVRITGWISSEQVRKELLAARALVLPSFAEGLPVVIMEAMALRRPVISTLIAGIPELVEPGRHGWLVPAGDVELLANAMKDCLDASPERIGQLGRASQLRVLESHDADIEASKLAIFFRSQVADNLELDKRADGKLGTSL
jgi:glycosyltransferase involved in cell wall biosynthesis